MIYFVYKRIYFLVLLLSVLFTRLSMFCILSTLFSSSPSFVLLSNIGCKSNTPMQVSIRHAGMINRLIKYVATLKDANKIVRYIKFFIDTLYQKMTISQGEIT